MKIGLTGGTGFIGRYLIKNLLDHQHQLNCWHRSTIDEADHELNRDGLQWIHGDLAQCDSVNELVSGCDVVVHNAFWTPGTRFQGEEGDIVKFVETNVIGALKLIEASISAGVRKFIFVSTCAVHEKILEDRNLDEAHPLWPKSHYGAHKAAIEKFVHSYGLGHGFDICAIRPTGVYGLHHHPRQSKWYSLISDVVSGNPVECNRGGKEVHAADVAESIRLLIDHPQTKGEAYSCYDQYVSQFEVATIAKEISQSQSEVRGEVTRPKHQIDNSKIKSVGMKFGGTPLLRQTIESIVQQIQSESC